METQAGAVSAGELSDFVRQMFQAVGMGEEDARLLSASLVDSDCHGMSTHGTARVAAYCAQLACGQVNPTPQEHVVAEKPSALRGLANELQVSMIRAAYSPIIKEMFDCSAGLLSPDGEYLALADVTVTDTNTVTVDTSRSDPQLPLPFNVVLSNVRSAALVALCCFLSQDVPMNAGIERCLAVRCVPGRVTNPSLSAPVGARAALAALVNEAVVDAFGQAHPRLRAAGSSGGTTMPYVWAHDGGILIDNSITGGMGATSQQSGAHVVDNSVTNAMSYPTEVLEQDHPLLMEAVARRRGSGGVGQHSSGDGMVRRVRLMAPGVLSLRGYRSHGGPPGVDGGQPGAPSRWTLLRDGVEQVLAPQQTGLSIRAGDVLVIETPGGGGWGHPTREADHDS